MLTGRVVLAACLLATAAAVFADKPVSGKVAPASAQGARKDVQELKTLLQELINELSPEAKDCIEKIFVIMGQDKSYAQIDQEIKALIAATPEAVQKEIEEFEKKADQKMAEASN